MAIYLLLALFSLFLAPIVRYYKNGDNLYLCLMFGAMFVIAGFRNVSVGTDTPMYVRFYGNIVNSFLITASNWTDQESSYFYIVKLCSYLGSYRFLLISYAAITMFCVAYFIKKNSWNVVMSTYLFITAYMFCASMNIIRAYAAVAIACNALPFLEEKKIIKSALVLLIAVFFHKSALFFFPVLLIAVTKPTIKNIIIIAASLAVIVVMWANGQLFGALVKSVTFLADTNILFGRYTRYYGSNDFQAREVTVQWIVWLAEAVLVVISMFAIRKLQDDMADKQLITKLYLLTIFIMISFFLNLSSVYTLLFYRIDTMYYIYLIILVPIVVSIYKLKNVFYYLGAPLLFVYFCLMLLRNNADVVPYRMF